MDSYFVQHRNFDSTVDYCHWLETQSPLEMVYRNSPDRICWRIKNLRSLLQSLYEEGFLSDAYEDYHVSEKSFERANFSLAMTGSCNGAPIKMPGADNADKALILTSGHCIGSPKIDSQFNMPVRKTILLKRSFADTGFTVAADHLIFSTQTGADLALYQSTLTYEQLNRRGFSAYELSPHPLEIGQTLRFYSLNFQKESQMLCEMEGLVPNLVEGNRISEGVYRMTLSPTCHFQPGDSGAIGIGENGQIFGVAQTLFEGGKPCTTDSPCENGNPDSVYPGQVYLSPIDRILTCFDQETRQFNFDLPDCQIK